MDYRSIVVHLDAGRHCAERTAVAIRLALDFHAHLAGVYAAANRELPAGIAAQGAPDLTEAWQRLYRDRGRAATGLFLDATLRHGLTEADARTAAGDPVEALCLNALYADLLVLGQHDPEEDSDDLGLPTDLVERVLHSAARPLLLVPYAGSFPGVGYRVLVAWNASPTAARAVRGALPLLRRAASVVVLTIDPHTTGGHGELPGADIALYLARHGVRVEASESHARGADAGSWLLSRACDLSADLIVMGGYGHSRLGETLFGGVTRSVLQQMTVPVLMEH